MADLKFTKSHEWIRIEGDIAAIGITDYAQRQLGDIVFIELPKPADKLEQSSQFGTIESTKAASEIYSPLSGQIVEVNNDLINNPQWINEDSLGKGWMIKVRMENAAELNSLLDENAYKEYVEQESK